MNFFVRRQSNLYFLRLFRHCIIEVIIILIRHRATPISYTTFQLQQLTILLQTPYQQTACKSKYAKSNTQKTAASVGLVLVPVNTVNGKKQLIMVVGKGKGKGKGFPYSTPSVGPELIPVYRQSACR